MKWIGEPRSGWYYSFRGNGYGPFATAAEAMDDGMDRSGKDMCRTQASKLKKPILHYIQVTT